MKNCVRAPLRFLSLTSFHQVCQQSAPLRPELVSAGEAAVASDHTQVGDAQLHQVAGGLLAALPGLEVFASGAANHSAALAWAMEMNGVK